MAFSETEGGQRAEGGEKIFIMAGEASGDLHASMLVQAYRSLRPETRFFGVGGHEMERAGVELLFSNSRLAVVGLVEILAHAGEIWRAYREVTGWLEYNRPKVLVLIDYPEFNLLIARRAKALGIKVFYYISPQVWAWREGRVKKIKALVDEMAVILPFEQEFYRRHGMKVHFVGHPLLDVVRPSMEQGEFLDWAGLSQDRVTVALLPGSRSGEVRRHMGLMLETASMMAKEAAPEQLQFVVPVAQGLNADLKAFMKEMAASYSDRGLAVTVIDGHAYDAMAASSVAVLASGTVALEAAILGVPMVVTYRLSPVTYFFGKLLVKVKWASLVNLIAGRQVVPELLQKDATPEKVARTALALLRPGSVRDAMLEGLEETVAKLGQPGAAMRAARLLAG